MRLQHLWYNTETLYILYEFGWNSRNSLFICECLSAISCVHGSSILLGYSVLCEVFIQLAVISSHKQFCCINSISDFKLWLFSSIYYSWSLYCCNVCFSLLPDICDSPSEIVLEEFTQRTTMKSRAEIKTVENRKDCIATMLHSSFL